MSRVVTVTDTVKPLLSLTGADTVSLECGDAYEDPGATASDSCAGDLTINVTVTNPANPAVFFRLSQ